MKTYVVAPILLLSLIIGLMIPLPISNTHNISLGVMTVTVRDANGNIVQEYKQKINGPTKQFVDLLSLLFANQPDNIYRSTTNGAGSVVIIGVAGGSSAAAYEYNFLDIASTDPRVLIGFGNGTNPSYSITKYSLDNLLAKIPASSPVIGISSSNITITISASYSPSNDTNITEVGIYYRFDKYTVTDNDYADILIVYDVLATPVSVPAGGSITVTYNFVINI